ncbi:hypothetical protein FOTG_17756 [Fusarium oxysporum f. sp. vasinfectum 25433]|uniref:Uncharacterized protein n=1 Tax=Fusarium oxysporum f. sp. vasinfectum 25433 TaxID=1089449 RepID=X0KJZ4_FUSOX|nr:hypothetical protein FOTG_17756 [Fusarium oxysporum f. sp. vasinfectum 25433]EXM13798.1 hypothetical protein FOTG_17756 [Fusarium oxysporum f. sp. vasinfectum 25433]
MEGNGHTLVRDVYRSSHLQNLDMGLDDQLQNRRLLVCDIPQCIADAISTSR